jgi:hypothetical protein
VLGIGRDALFSGIRGLRRRADVARLLATYLAEVVLKDAAMKAMCVPSLVLTVR